MSLKVWSKSWFNRREVIQRMKTFLQNEAGFPISEVNYVQTCHLHAFVYCYGIFLRL
jgi:hypothetical protein